MHSVGNYYETIKAYVEEQLDKGAYISGDLDTGAVIWRMFLTVLMFITPPSAAELENRLRGRGTVLRQKPKARLSRAAEEAEGVEDYDYILSTMKSIYVSAVFTDIVLSEKMKAKYNLGLINNIKEELKVYSKGE